VTFSPVPAKNSAVAHVLVVDDEPLIRWSLAEVLGQGGHIVTEAGDAKETLWAVTRAAVGPDVILLDYRLPDSNDLSLFATIKRALPEIPIILMTAYGSPEITAGALALGAYRVVSKPFEVKDLVTLVEQACAWARREP
jgi:two-component system nitrogen regulation response regulator GlnG